MQTWVRIEKRSDAVIIRLAGGSVTVTKYGTAPACIRWAALSNPSTDDARTMAQMLVAGADLAESLDRRIKAAGDCGKIAIEQSDKLNTQWPVYLVRNTIFVKSDLELCTEGFEPEAVDNPAITPRKQDFYL